MKPKREQSPLNIQKKSLGQRLKEARSGKMTQKELAQKVGVTTITIQNYENDRRKPSIDMLIKIADALEIALSQLIESQSDTLTNKLFNIIDNEIFDGMDAENTIELLWELSDIDVDVLSDALKKGEDVPEGYLIAMAEVIIEQNSDLFNEFWRENQDLISGHSVFIQNYKRKRFNQDFMFSDFDNEVIEYITQMVKICQEHFNEETSSSIVTQDIILAYKALTDAYSNYYDENLGFTISHNGSLMTGKDLYRNLLEKYKVIFKKLKLSELNHAINNDYSEKIKNQELFTSKDIEALTEICKGLPLSDLPLKLVDILNSLSHENNTNSKEGDSNAQDQLQEKDNKR